MNKSASGGHGASIGNNINNMQGTHGITGERLNPNHQLLL